MMQSQWWIQDDEHPTAAKAVAAFLDDRRGGVERVFRGIKDRTGMSFARETVVNGTYSLLAPEGSRNIGSVAVNTTNTNGRGSISAKVSAFTVNPPSSPTTCSLVGQFAAESINAINRGGSCGASAIGIGAGYMALAQQFANYSTLRDQFLRELNSQGADCGLSWAFEDVTPSWLDEQCTLQLSWQRLTMNGEAYDKPFLISTRPDVSANAVLCDMIKQQNNLECMRRKMLDCGFDDLTPLPVEEEVSTDDESCYDNGSAATSLITYYESIVDRLPPKSGDLEANGYCRDAASNLTQLEAMIKSFIACISGHPVDSVIAVSLEAKLQNLKDKTEPHCVITR